MGSDAKRLTALLVMILFPTPIHCCMADCSSLCSLEIYKCTWSLAGSVCTARSWCCAARSLYHDHQRAITSRIGVMVQPLHSASSSLDVQRSSLMQEYWGTIPSHTRASPPFKARALSGRIRSTCTTCRTALNNEWQWLFSTQYVRFNLRILARSLDGLS